MRATPCSTHDRRCRSVHLAAAAQLGVGMGCVSQRTARDTSLRRAQRGESARRARRSLQCRFDRDGRRSRVIDKERKRLLLNACAEVHNALRHIYEDEGKLIVLDRTLLRRLKVESWQQALGPFRLPLADEQQRRRMAERHRQLGRRVRARRCRRCDKRARAVAARRSAGGALRARQDDAGRGAGSHEGAGASTRCSCPAASGRDRRSSICGIAFTSPMVWCRRSRV